MSTNNYFIITIHKDARSPEHQVCRINVIFRSIFGLQTLLHSIIVKKISIDVGKAVEGFTTIVNTKMRYKLSAIHTCHSTGDCNGPVGTWNYL